MADKPLFDLDDAGRWRLAYDPLQWVVQRREGKPYRHGSDTSVVRSSGWKAVAFIAGEKRGLDHEAAA